MVTAEPQMAKLNGWYWFFDQRTFVVTYVEGLTYSELARELAGTLQGNSTEWIWAAYKEENIK